MASATVTVTAKTGPAVTVTAQVFTEIKQLVIDVEKQMVSLFKGPGTAPYKEFDLAAVTTITDVLAGAGLGHTVTIS